MGGDAGAERIEIVTAQDLCAMANEWFHQDRIAVAMLGNLNGFQLEREALAC